MGPWLLAPENAAALTSALAGGQLPGGGGPAALPAALATPLLEALVTALEVRARAGEQRH
jgi:hypothetical protein